MRNSKGSVGLSLIVILLFDSLSGCRRMVGRVMTSFSMRLVMHTMDCADEGVELDERYVRTSSSTNWASS